MHTKKHMVSIERSFSVERSLILQWTAGVIRGIDVHPRGKIPGPGVRGPGGRGPGGGFPRWDLIREGNTLVKRIANIACGVGNV